MVCCTLTRARMVYRHHFDEEGNLIFIKYQDHGTLPDGAAKPSEAPRSRFTFVCGGCPLEGEYEQVITPSGQYHSSGPVTSE